MHYAQRISTLRVRITGTYARRLQSHYEQNDPRHLEMMRRRARRDELRQEREYREQMRLLNLEARWDETVHKVTPDPLRGVKPITREPWARDAYIYARKTGSFETEVGDRAAEEYNDESALDSNNGYLSTVRASPGGGGGGPNASLGRHDRWDYSTFRHRPVTLRGMKPGGREPWNHDEKVLGIYREWMGKEEQLKLILSDEPGKPYTVADEEDGKGWKERWAAEAEALYNALTKGATSLFSWANLGGKKMLKGPPSEKAGVLEVGKGIPYQGKNGDRNNDPNDIGDKERDPTATFRYDGMNSWSAWAVSLNPADKAMLARNDGLSC